MMPTLQTRAGGKIRGCWKFLVAFLRICLEVNPAVVLRLRMM
jgi:hypothetical protein